MMKVDFSFHFFCEIYFNKFKVYRLGFELKYLSVIFCSIIWALEIDAIVIFKERILTPYQSDITYCAHKKFCKVMKWKLK